MNKITATSNSQLLFICLFLKALLSLIPAVLPFRVEVTIQPPAINITSTRFAYNGTETFDSRESLTTETQFSLDIKGTYQDRGYMELVNASAYGGAGGVGKHVDIINATLTFSSFGPRGLNFFGLLITYLEPQNSLEFFSGETKICSWNATKVDEVTRSKTSNGKNDYVKSPDVRSGIDARPYVFVNFYFYDALFDKIRFVTTSGIINSDNHTVGYFTGRSGELIEQYEYPGTYTSSTSTPSTSSTQSTSSTPSTLSTQSNSKNTANKNQNNVSIMVIAGFVIIQLLYDLL